MKENTSLTPKYYFETETTTIIKNDIHELASAVTQISNVLQENPNGEIIGEEYASSYNSNTGLTVYTALITTRLKRETPVVPIEEVKESCHCPLRYSEENICSSECLEFYKTCVKDKCKYFYKDEE